MRSLFKLLIVSALFAWSFTTFAAGVKNLEAQFADDQIYVRWQALEDEKASYYNVYYSRKSILQNEGEYDDYERVRGNRTELILTEFPSGSSLFIAVLPVNERGLEMEGFTEEIELPLTEGARAGVAQPETPTTTPVAEAAEPSATAPSLPRASEASRGVEVATVSDDSQFFAQLAKPTEAETIAAEATVASGSADWNGLTHTGFEAIGLVAMSGGVVGWAWKRKW